MNEEHAARDGEDLPSPSAESNPTVADIVPPVAGDGSNVAAVPPSINAGIMKVIEAKKQSNTLRKTKSNINNSSYNSKNKHRTSNNHNHFQKTSMKKHQSTKSFYSKNRSQLSSNLTTHAQVVSPNRDFQAFRGGNMNFRSSTYPGAGCSNNVFQNPQRWFPPVVFGNSPTAAGVPYYYYDNVQSNSMHSARF